MRSEHATAALRPFAVDYHHQGFALLPGLLAPALVQRLQAATQRIQHDQATLPAALRDHLVFERDLSVKGRSGVEATAVGDAIFIIGDPPAFDPVFGELLQHAGLCAAARALLGTQGLVFHFMNVTIKHAGFGRAIGWHRDYPNSYMSTPGADFLRLMLPLDGMDADMGATGFVGGTHGVSDDEARRLKADKVRADEPAPERLQWAHCAAGDLVAIHPKVLHGGGMNRSGRARRNVVLQVGRADAPVIGEGRESITGLPVLG
ncbi:MAG: hypothetical protein EOO29_07685 [Comamonadaceae bacterium]|nr:MAG: hypothetical protein EOO29_07685 [Comamonadaceae bacterium]